MQFTSISTSFKYLSDKNNNILAVSKVTHAIKYSTNIRFNVDVTDFVKSLHRTYALKI